MQNMGISVLFKGNNFLRLCQGLWVTLRISLIARIFSILPACSFPSAWLPQNKQGKVTLVEA